MAKTKTGFVVTDEVLDRIKEMASRGVPQYVMAAQFGISSVTFEAHKARDPRVKEAIIAGKASTVQYAENKLISIMHDDSPENKQMMFKALLFFLKTKGGWSTNRVVEVTGPSAPSSITFIVDEEDD